MKPLPPSAHVRRYVVHGRVQGVGFRAFVQRRARALGLRGHVFNREDGAVEVHASGEPAALAALAVELRQGPVWSSVSGVEESEGAMLDCEGFHIR